MASTATELTQTAVKLVVALIKHRLRTVIGDEALEIAAKEIVDLGGDRASGKIESILRSREGSERLLEVGFKTDKCFRTKCEDRELLEAFTLSFGDLPSVQDAISDFTDQLDETALKDVFHQTLARDFKTLEPQKIDEGVELYMDCLRRALVEIEVYTTKIIVSILLDIRKKVDTLTEEQRDGFSRIESQLDQFSKYVTLIHQGIIIRAPVERVWGYLSQKEKWPNPVSLPTFDKPQLALPDVDIPPRERGDLNLILLNPKLPPRIKTPFELMESKANKYLKWKSGFLGYRIIVNYRLTAIDEDRTRLDCIVGADGHGVEAGIFRFLLTNIYEKTFITAIQELVAEIDRG